MTSGLPFDDIRAILKALPAIDAGAAERAAARRDRAILPSGALGHLDGAAQWCAGVTGRPGAGAARPVMALFAGSHGLDGHLDPAARVDAAGFVERAGRGAAAVAQACAANEFGLKVYDLALDLPLPDISAGPALDEKACAATMAFGMESIGGGADLVCLASVGRGGMASAAALASALRGGDPREWLPAGAAGAAEAAAAALECHRAHLADPLEALRRLGGRETAAIAGAILAARTQRIPVILDGRHAVAAALVLAAADPDAAAHCRLAAPLGSLRWDEAARAAGLAPLADPGIGEGEGLAAAFAAVLVRSALAVHNGLAAAGS